jgi:hypothetical protein
MDDDGNQPAYIYDGTAYRFITNKGWQSYTPTHAGHGAATFSANTGRFQTIGEKTAYVNLFFQTSHAGSGATGWTVSLPFTPNRTARQVLTGTYQLGSAQAAGAGLITTSGSGAKIDIMKMPSNSVAPDGDLNDWLGSDIPNGAIFVISGAIEIA